MRALSIAAVLCMSSLAFAQTDSLTINATWNQPTTGSYHLWPITSLAVNAELWQKVNGSWTVISRNDKWCYTDQGDTFRLYRNPNKESIIWFQSNWVYLWNPVGYPPATVWYKCRLYWAVTIPAGGSNPTITAPVFWEIEPAN